MTSHFCALCGLLAPTCGTEHMAGEWFRLDLDGRAGARPPVWICPSHQDEPEAVMAALR